MKSRVASELSHSKEVRHGEILGFVLGDGSITKKGNQISFANNEACCIKRILEDFCIVFDTKAENFKYYLAIPENTSEAKALSHWRKALGALDFKISKHKKTGKSEGCLSVVTTNAELKNAIIRRTNRILDGKEKNEKILVGFLRGFFAAEGTIILGKPGKGAIHSVQFPQKGKTVLEPINGILAGLGIEGRIVIKQKKAGYYCVNITGYENFEKILRMGIIDIHLEKREKLASRLASYGKVVSRKLKMPSKLLRALEKKAMTREQLYEAMDSYPQNINGMIYSKKSYLVKNGLIAKEINQDGMILWKITEDGREFLRTYN